MRTNLDLEKVFIWFKKKKKKDVCYGQIKFVQWGMLKKKLKKEERQEIKLKKLYLIITVKKMASVWGKRLRRKSLTDNNIHKFAHFDIIGD